MYPSNWPKCPQCGDPCMDGKATCGNASCIRAESGDFCCVLCDSRRRREREPDEILKLVSGSDEAKP